MPQYNFITAHSQQFQPSRNSHEIFLRVSFACKNGNGSGLRGVADGGPQIFRDASEKGRWIREEGHARSSNRDGDSRLARGTDQGPSVCEGLWRAWLNLIIVVSPRKHTHVRARARTRVMRVLLVRRERLVRASSRKCDSLRTIRDELNILISSGTLKWLFSTLRGV